MSDEKIDKYKHLNDEKVDKQRFCESLKQKKNSKKKLVKK